MQILVLEDQDDQRELLCAILGKLGHTVHCVAQADEAILLGREGFAPDLLVSDITLKGTLDGYDVALYWRSKFPRLPVLYLSAREEVDLARRMAGSVYLSKPIPAQALIAAVENLLSTARGPAGRLRGAAGPQARTVAQRRAP
jgi:DNA-binding response OmpR family regulator